MPARSGALKDPHRNKNVVVVRVTKRAVHFADEHAIDVVRSASAGLEGRTERPKVMVRHAIGLSEA